MAFPHVSKDNPPLVVEGYVDTIALHQCGFKTAVAPLGTAFTDEHMKQLWQRHPCPLFCFDGDAAGRKAAFRVAQRLFPLLKPNLSVQFSFLPDGEDPDTYLKTYGRDMFGTMLKQTKSLMETVWTGYMDHMSMPEQPSPEEKTAFKKALMGHMLDIVDADLKNYFIADLNNRLAHTFTLAPQRTMIEKIKSSRSSVNVRRSVNGLKNKAISVKILLATLKNNPTLISRLSEHLVNIDADFENYNAFKGFLIDHYACSYDDMKSKAIQQGFQKIIHDLDHMDLVSLAPFSRKDTDEEIAFKGWLDVFQHTCARGRVLREAGEMKEELKQTLNHEVWMKWQHMKITINKTTH
jgi:DNA primase